MFSALTRRAVRPRPSQGIGRTTVRAIIATWMLMAPQIVTAQTQANFEKPPVLKATQLLPAKLLQGKGFRVEERVPTDGIMGTYTLRADQETFGEDAGTYRVLSREMAELRLSEVPAIIKLNETSKPPIRIAVEQLFGDADVFRRFLQGVKPSLRSRYCEAQFDHQMWIARVSDQSLQPGQL